MVYLLQGIGYCLFRRSSKIPLNKDIVYGFFSAFSVIEIS